MGQNVREMDKMSERRPDLSPNQKEYVRLAAIGWTDAEIAQEIGVNPRSLRRWRANGNLEAEVAKERGRLHQQQMREVLKLGAEELSLEAAELNLKRQEHVDGLKALYPMWREQIGRMVPLALDLLEEVVRNPGVRVDQRIKAASKILEIAGVGANISEPVPKGTERGLSERGLSPELVHEIRRNILGQREARGPLKPAEAQVETETEVRAEEETTAQTIDIP